MRSLFILVFLLFGAWPCLAQDLLIDNKGDSIQCVIKSIEGELLNFKPLERQNDAKVPVSVLHKYLRDGVWHYVGPLLGQSVSAPAPGFATARIFESQYKAFSAITVIYEDGSSEIIDLGTLSFFSAGGTNRALVDNQKVINWFLNEMFIKGYEVDKMTSSGDSFFYTFIIFRKSKK